jgi:hypothetical protein
VDVVTARSVVAAVNELLGQKPWIDMEVMEYAGTTLTVMGGIDPSAPPEVKISFVDVHFMCLPTEWKTDTSRPVLDLLEGEAAVALNRRFQVTVGHHIFRFFAEGYPEDFGCLVCAREVTFVST